MASLTLALPEDNSLVPVTLRINDDLPSHIKGTATWNQGQSIRNPFTYKVSINDRETPVEFINNHWFILTFQWDGFHTKRSSLIAPENVFGLRSFPKQPTVPPSQTSSHAGFGYNPTAESLSESGRGSTVTQQSFSDAPEAPVLHIDTSVLQSEVPPNPAAPPVAQPHRNLNQSHNMTTVNPPPNGGGSLRGTALNIFTGNRDCSDAFLAEFHRYQLLNRNNAAMSNPFNCVLTTLLYIRGPVVDDWVSAQDQKLKRCLLDPLDVNHVPDTEETLWTEFEASFKSAWKDSEKLQSTYKQLMKLMMRDLDVDSYTATFERLALAAGWEADAQGTIERYRRGLRENVHRRILNRDREPVTMVEWIEAVRTEVHKIQRTAAAGLDFRSKNKPRDLGLFKPARLNTQTRHAARIRASFLWRSMPQPRSPNSHSRNSPTKNAFSTEKRAAVSGAARRAIWPGNARVIALKVHLLPLQQCPHIPHQTQSPQSASPWTTRPRTSQWPASSRLPLNSRALSKSQRSKKRWTTKNGVRTWMRTTWTQIFTVSGSKGRLPDSS